MLTPEDGPVDGAWDRAERLLCVRLDTLGDVLMTTPALRALRASKPQCRLTLLTSPAGADVARLIPEVDAVLVFDAPWMKASGRSVSSRGDLAFVEVLKHGGFDGAVIFTVYSQSALPAAYLCYLADIPLRLAHCRENPYHLLTNWVPETEPAQRLRHEVRRQLDLVRVVGGRTDDLRLSLALPDACTRTVARLLAERLPPGAPWVVLHPGATAASRRYPAEGFAEVGRRLVRECGLEVVFTGTASERALVEEIQAAMDAPSWSLAGAVDVATFAALLARAPLLVSNNTGAVHVAAAVGTPVVDLYALTNPQHTPWGVPHRVLYHDVPCKYCYKSVCPEGHQDCLRLVTPEAVVQAVQGLLVETGRDAYVHGEGRVHAGYQRRLS